MGKHAGKTVAGKVQDVDTSTVLALVGQEQLVAQSAQVQLQERERLTAQTYQMIGQIKAAGMIGKFITVSNLMWLQQVKQSKIYKDISGAGTWEDFCNSAGLSRQMVDEDLKNLAAFGEDFLITVNNLSVGYRELRKLRQLSADGVFQITGTTIEIDGEAIPLDPEHKEDLQVALERVLDAKDSDLATKDRLLRSKDAVINEQEKDLRKLEKEAKNKGLEPGEDAFIQRMEKARVGFDGYMMRTDPDLVMEPFSDLGEITPRMRAMLISTLHYMKMQILSAYDNAVTNYGDPSMNPELLDDFMNWTKTQAQKE
jgi:hypothetical protein